MKTTTTLNAKKLLREIASTEEFHVETAKLQFAIELKRVMERDGLSNAELADRLGVSRPMVSKVLKGDANLTIETMVRVAKCLNGQLYLKILRDGCDARLFEIAKGAEHRVLKRRAGFGVASHGRAVTWDSMPEQVRNEAKPVAA